MATVPVQHQKKGVVGKETAYRSTNLILEPGGRLVIVTDGMLKRGAAARHNR